MMTRTSRLVVTPGEPAGIGPDLIVQLAQQAWPAELVIIADPALLKARAKQLHLPLQLLPYQADAPPQPQAKGTLTVLPIPVIKTPVAGTLNPANARYVLETLHRSCDGCLSHEFDAWVTGPVHKSVINQAGVAFSGHTEFLAEQSNTKHVVMMLATQGLRVALATTHIPLAKVAKTITAMHLERVIRILHRELQEKFAIQDPCILVCGLNPHAGEEGHLGREEIEIITPTLDKLHQEGYSKLSGPLPADTLFQEKLLKDADAVLAMYHDQGLPVLKYKGFGKSINITLGLPFIRVSVDHGTALPLAGTGTASTDSFKTALYEALTLIERKQHESSTSRAYSS